MTEVDPEEKKKVRESFTYSIKLQICQVLERWFRVLSHCHTVLQSIARDLLLTARYNLRPVVSLSNPGC